MTLSYQNIAKNQASCYTIRNMTEKIAPLIAEAKQRMGRSTDPAHDLTHAEHVARFATQLADETRVPADQKMALVLAAWWHDVSRTMTKNPSLIWMPFFDDLLSALLLWLAAIRHGLWGSVVGLSIRLTVCKSLGAGAILTQLLVRRRHRLLIDLLKDADALDVLSLERLRKLMPLVESCRRYHWAYKTLIRWFVSTRHLHMKTRAARAYAIKLFRTFLQWIKAGAIYFWHVAQFGRAWCERTYRRAERLLAKIERLYLAGAF